MTTRHLVDPEILPLIDLMPFTGFTRESLPAARVASAERFAFLGEPPLAPQVKTIAGPGGVLEIYWYDPSPDARDRPALLHIHGGGMIIGSAKSMQHGPSGTAAALGIPVASVEYRLAPEHPFPAPQEDCLAALAWLAGSADELGIDPARIGIIGESAGGGLAAATALMARDTGGPALAAQFLTYPMLDHRTGGQNCPWHNPTTGEFIWNRESNVFGWEALRGDYAADDVRKGWFSPALAEDLSGLPPTWIGTGALDLFLDEDLDYARRLVAAGVEVELHCYPGAIHAFNAVAESRIAKAFARDQLGAIARLLRIP
ncbi:alpha/beta hydrolase [Novosphingobium sp.]|jgi:acetyl esterase|uniref:alpha/beta hydrolase n=1 Tax=Novosphingobium sp. TaxID=1874826 RepID=UPI001EB8DDD9|nr:alpha/beta hydrolase [Novosphingobium sp.]MBK6801563.1 alpha/beta hydrolase [Novosphingobium sp.]MBK9010533.1 alpha/beta hydrolase [Novosphingobium sp.]